MPRHVFLEATQMNFKSVMLVFAPRVAWAPDARQLSASAAAREGLAIVQETTRINAVVPKLFELLLETSFQASQPLLRWIVRSYL